MKVLLVAALLLMVPLRAETEGIAAKVNGEIITTAEVDDQVNSWFHGSDLTGDQLQAARKERRDQVLQALIERELILQSFVHEGEKLPGDYIDRRLDTIIAENYGGDRNAFVSTMKERGITVEKYRQEIADNWIINHMRQKHPAPGWGHSLLATAAVTIY